MIKFGAMLAPIFFVFSSMAFGQGPTGELRLDIKDLTGASVELSGRLVGPGGERTFQTDAQGAFIFTELLFGRYQLVVSKAGFATQSVLIDIEAATPLSRTVTLSLTGTTTRVDVVATTPLAGVELSRDQIPTPVQAATQGDVQNSGALDLADFMNRRLDGVNVNENQGNPFQPDVNYRGYTASPLLGTPQGLSVYMDGVRLNQPFGDVVSWDLIPRIAIGEITLMPGSNPVFGLNTLGGALSLQSKDGITSGGTTVQIGYGSYDRKTLEFENGGSTRKGFNWYVAGNGFADHGWRAASPSNVRQLFTKFGWQNGKTFLSFTSAYANNTLIGNGLQEQRLLARDYSSVYTVPDVTVNRSPFFNFSARHAASSNLMFSGNVYYRYILTNTLNGDLNDDSLDQAVYQPGGAERTALAAAGYTGVPASGATAANTPFPFWRCIGNALIRDEPGEKCNGLLNRTRTNQHNYGISGQMTWVASLSGHHNQLTVGGGFDGSNARFGQSSELGYLNPDRSITGVGAFGDGVTGGNVDGEPFDTRVDLHGRIRTGSIYATDTFSVNRALSFTVSGRYNRTGVRNRDSITPGGGPGSLDSDNAFGRFNPAVGVTFNPSPFFNTYFNYSEGSRAPTSIELGCADPTQPCKLPNALAGDPPLNQVVTRTVEAGVRGSVESHLDWNIGWFRGENHNDILFVASTQTGFGYFKNFGQTRRQGLEVDLSGRYWRMTIGGSYTFLDATYQSSETIDGSGNSTNDSVATTGKGLEGNIHIQPGNRIPLIPQHLLKAYLDIQATSKLTVNLGMTASSKSFARGNENNLHQPDGVFYIGPGYSPGYEIFNLGARYQMQKHIQLFIDVSNLGDRRYYTGAQIGATGITPNGTFIARPFSTNIPPNNASIVNSTFLAPGAPRIAWGGVRFTF